MTQREELREEYMTETGRRWDRLVTGEELSYASHHYTEWLEARVSEPCPHTCHIGRPTVSSEELEQKVAKFLQEAMKATYEANYQVRSKTLKPLHLKREQFSQIVDIMEAYAQHALTAYRKELVEKVKALPPGPLNASRQTWREQILALLNETKTP